MLRGVKVGCVNQRFRVNKLRRGVYLESYTDAYSFRAQDSLSKSFPNYPAPRVERPNVKGFRIRDAVPVHP